MKTSRTHIVIATTLFAVLVWISVNMSYQYQTTLPASLVAKNIPEGKAIRTPFPRSLQLRFRGDGWQLAGVLIGSDLSVVLDVGTFPSAQQRALTLGDVVERLQLPLGLQPVAMKPDSIFIELESSATRRVPVVFDGSVSFREGFGLVGPATVDPESVTISGARSVLDRFTSWWTVYRTFPNLNASVESRVPLAGSDNFIVTVVPAEVTLRMRVEPFAEKRFSGLPVDVLSVPPNREVILIPPKMDIVVRGGIELLATLGAGDFRASIDYASILSDTTGMMDPAIEAPRGVQIVSRKPDRLEYVIRKRL